MLYLLTHNQAPDTLSVSAYIQITSRPKCGLDDVVGVTNGVYEQIERVQAFNSWLGEVLQANLETNNDEKGSQTSPVCYIC